MRLLLLLAALAAGPAAAAVPGTLRLQGRLIDPSTSDPRTEASVSMSFRVYDAVSGGTLLWSEAGVTVPLDDGAFEAELGASTPLSSAVFSGAGRWLEVEAAGVTLSPRQHLVSAPWGLRAAAADYLEPGAANYLNNTSDLQGGSSFHAASASVSGQFTATGLLWALGGLEVRGVVRTGTALQQITTAGGKLDAAKTDPATTVPNAALDASSVTKLGNAADGPGGLAVLDGSGYVPAARLPGVVTRQGNSFNGPSQLVELTAGALVPNAVVDGSSVAKLSTSGRIPNSLLDASSVTKLGNSFNASESLVLLGAGPLVPNAQVDGSSIALLSPSGKIHNTHIDASSVTMAGNAFNAAGQLVRLDASGTLNASGAGAAVYSIVASSGINVTGTGAKLRENGLDLVPQNILIIWTGPACPPGWTEETTLRGRVPLGACAACTNGLTFSTAFSADGQGILHFHDTGTATGTGHRTGGSNSLTDQSDAAMPYIQVLFCRKT